jgi:hypothetical protein
MLGHLDAEQIERLLHSEIVGRIGCHTEGCTYVVPVTYTYDGSSVYCHSAEGMKLRMMRANPDVCFEIEHMDNLTNWQSVIAWGKFEELHGADASHAMMLLIRRFMPMMTSETAQPPHGHGAAGEGHGSGSGKAAVLYRIRLTEKTGRFEKR